MSPARKNRFKTSATEAAEHAAGADGLQSSVDGKVERNA